jgi:hypothetical protein
MPEREMAGWEAKAEFEKQCENPIKPKENPKFQAPKCGWELFGSWKLDVWCFPGAWSLELGAFSRSSQNSRV